MKKHHNKIRFGESNRLVAVAVINKRFRQLLLTEPPQAIEAEYEGEAFHLSPIEREAVLSIKAESIEEFAEQLVALLKLSEIKSQTTE